MQGYRLYVLDAAGHTAWGIWAEVAESDFHQIVEKWSDPQQGELPPMEARLANGIPRYPETVGLPAMLQLTGPTTRPELTFDGSSIHPFVVECRHGVCTHRVMEWLQDVR